MFAGARSPTDEQKQQKKQHQKEVARRAERLLARHLSRSQLFTWRLLGYFYVRGGSSGRLYRICRQFGNYPWCAVDLMVPIHGIAFRALSYCMVTQGQHGPENVKVLPKADDALAKKLFLEADEGRFLRTAYLVGQGSGTELDEDSEKWPAVLSSDFR